MNFKNKWLLVAIAIIVIAIIVMIARQSEDPTTAPETTTTTIEEVVIDDTLPLDGDVIIDGEDVVVPDVVDPIEGEPTE